MKPRYLFIDDEVGEPTKAWLDGFCDVGLIQVESLTLDAEETFDSLSEKIQKEYAINGLDGILIDLCLDGTGANSLKFKAPPVAQQVRSLASESKISHLPIVLCSTNDKKSIYDSDKASHDLFDYYFNKTDINYKKESCRLLSLAKGYQMLNITDVTVGDVLGRSDIEALDSKIIDYLSSSQFSVFDISQRILKDIIQYQGILITERVVAARLGVDIEKSVGAWERLREAVWSVAAYNGTFASGWKRYWTDQFNDFFLNLSEGTPYQILTASERIDVLRKAGFDKLVAAKPIRFNHSTYYNTICCYSRCPLDSMEGIPIGDSMSLKPWQENSYVSFYHVANGDFKEEYLGHVGKERVAEIKERLRG